MFWEVLEDFPTAPDSSRPAGSIGAVRFEIQIDHTSQKPPKSINILHLQVDNLIVAAVTRALWKSQQKPVTRAL